MKIRIIVLLAAFMFAQTLSAQFHVGFKAGANITKVDGRSFKEEFKWGYTAGGFAEIKLSKKLFLQPEVMLNQFNTKLDTNYNNIVGNTLQGLSSIKLDYLSVPLLLNYKLGGGFLSLQAGPQFGILIDKDNSLVQNTGNAFKKGDLSMLGGLQLKVGAFRFNGRYFVGLNNINDLTNDSKWKNQGFQLSVGLALL